MTLGVWKGRYWREPVLTGAAAMGDRSKRRGYRPSGFVAGYEAVHIALRLRDERP
jgi:hypothetical protein